MFTDEVTQKEGTCPKPHGNFAMRAVAGPRYPDVRMLRASPWGRGLVRAWRMALASCVWTALPVAGLVPQPVVLQGEQARSGPQSRSAICLSHTGQPRPLR